MQNIEKAINTLAENILKVSKDTSSSSNFDVTLLGKVKQKLGNNQYIITLKNEDFTIKSVCAYEFSVGDIVLVLQINNDPKNKVIIGTYSSVNPSISQSYLPLSGGTLTGTSGIENRNPMFQWRLPDGKIYYISAGGTGNTDYFDLGLTLGDNNATVSSMIKFNKDGAIDYVKDPASARAALGVTSELSKKQTVYTSLEQIGLTIDTASSYAVVHNAMPENSMLVISWTGNAANRDDFGAFGQLMPDDYGTCIIRKNMVSQWKFYKYNTGVEYTGIFTTVNSEGWKGWNERASFKYGSFSQNVDITNSDAYLFLRPNGVNPPYFGLHVYGSNGTNCTFGIAGRQTGGATTNYVTCTTTTKQFVFAVAISNGSDRKLKTDIQPVEQPKKFIMDLQPVQFALKDDSRKATNYGFIAQDVKSTLDSIGCTNNNIVTEVDNDGENMLALSYTQIIAPLVATVQEQEQRITDLEKDVAELKVQLQNISLKLEEK